MIRKILEFPKENRIKEEIPSVKLITVTGGIFLWKQTIGKEHIEE